MSKAAREPVHAVDAPTPTGWLTWNAAVLIAGACAAAGFGRGVLLAVPALVSFTAFWRHRPTAVGLANRLTATRLTFVLLVTAGLPVWDPVWVMAAFSINVALDIIDGRVARGLGEVTSFGAVFDREADALFVLSAYLHFYLSLTDVGAWVLLPGLLPYLYRLSVVALRVPMAPENKERLAAPLAAINFALLLIATASGQRAAPILIASFLVVLASFSASFWNLYRHAYSLP